MARGIFVAACGLLVAACMQDLVSRPEVEPSPPSLGVQSLTHWTTREVPRSIVIFMSTTSPPALTAVGWTDPPEAKP